ncbi:MAG: hypothetical protein HOP24_09165 [Sideroxydans sp.]|nr:hypothetical protein [Sideroxydans sp.]
MTDDARVKGLAELLEQDLMGKYGPLISNDDLRQALGFASNDAFRQALARKTMPIPVFPLPNRRGKYALVKDVATWLSRQREAAAAQMK